MPASATSSNPLLDFTGLPDFGRIAPQHVLPAVKQLLERASQAQQAVTAPAFPAQWDAMARQLTVATEQLGRSWATVSHLTGVADSPELRAAYNAALPLAMQFWTQLGADPRLYAKYRGLDAATLSGEQRQALTNALRDFALGGADLTGAARERFAQIEQRLAELGQKFSENLLDATEAFACYVTAEDLAGVPPDVQQLARAAAQAEGRADYKLTLKAPCYQPVMRNARSSALRATLYRAYVTRASDASGPAGGQEFDNGPLIRETLALRREQAQLLGYANYGELSLASKMARSPEQVIAFLRDLAQRARPWAEKELAELRSFAAEHLALPDPQPWDWPYASEQLKQARYAFSEQELRQYFTAPKVLAGLFKIVETLFEVRIRPDQASTWDPQVSFYRIERAGRLLGQFYLDQTARTGKREGAWMDTARNRWQRPDSGALQTPVAWLVCNFAPAVDGKAPLLTHDDVLTLFHEFGHGLQHLLTQVDEYEVAGISGVEGDAVELPSQFMENFCWQWDVLADISAHVDTGVALPRALFDKMLAAKNFHSGLQTLHQIEFALFDMLLHTEHDPQQDFMALQERVHREVALLKPAPFARSAHSFSHIFAGGYAAGYYGYKWAEVLSADAWAAFEESADAQANMETGRRYRQSILETGGSRPAMESFLAFRGREPRLDALLRHQGMAAPPA